MPTAMKAVNGPKAYESELPTDTMVEVCTEFRHRELSLESTRSL